MCRGGTIWYCVALLQPFLLEKRKEARKQKDFAESDRLRDELKKIGIIIEDTPDGVHWKRV